MKKIDPKLKKELLSGKQELVLSAVNQVRESGNSAYIAVLAKLLNNSDNTEINKAVKDLFNDIRDKESTESIIEVLKNDEFKNIRKILISSCWQNSLHFEDYFILFVDFVISEEFEVAIEAFSVIDDMENRISKENLEKGKDIIKKAVGETNEEKLKLVHELYKHINDLLDELNLHE